MILWSLAFVAGIVRKVVRGSARATARSQEEWVPKELSYILST